MSELSLLSGGKPDLMFCDRRLPVLTQAVWKRFSYPNNCKQPGAMDLEETG